MYATPAIAKIRKRKNMRMATAAVTVATTTSRLAINTNTRCTYPFNQNGKIDTIIAFEFVKYYYYYFGSVETQGAKCVHELTCSGWCRDCCIKLVPSVKLGKKGASTKNRERRRKKSFDSRTHGPSVSETHRYRQSTHFCHINTSHARTETPIERCREPWTASWWRLNDGKDCNGTIHNNNKKSRPRACATFSQIFVFKLQPIFSSLCLLVNLAITYTDLIYHQIKGIKCDHFDLKISRRKKWEKMELNESEMERLKRMLNRGHFRLETIFFLLFHYRRRRHHRCCFAHSTNVVVPFLLCRKIPNSWMQTIKTVQPIQLSTKL